MFDQLHIINFFLKIDLNLVINIYFFYLINNGMVFIFFIDYILYSLIKYITSSIL